MQPVIRLFSTLLFGFSLICLADCGVPEKHANPEVRGKWWCESLRPTEPEPVKPPEPPFLPPVPERPPVFKYREMLAMHPDQLEKLHEAHQRWAVYTRKEKDIYQYLRVLDAGRRKSAGFAAATDVTLLKHPELSSEPAWQTDNAGLAVQRREHDRSILDKLAQYRNRYALGLFVRSGCGYCDVATNVMKDIQASTGWRIQVMDIKQEPRYIEAFNISITPAVVLIERSGQRHWPVAMGVKSRDFVLNRIYNMVRLVNNEIQPQQFHTDNISRHGFYDPLYNPDQTTQQ